MTGPILKVATGTDKDSHDLIAVAEIVEESIAGTVTVTAAPRRIFPPAPVLFWKSKTRKTLIFPILAMRVASQRIGTHF